MGFRKPRATDIVLCFVFACVGALSGTFGVQCILQGSTIEGVVSLVACGVFIACIVMLLTGPKGVSDDDVAETAAIEASPVTWHASADVAVGEGKPKPCHVYDRAAGLVLDFSGVWSHASEWDEVEVAPGEAAEEVVLSLPAVGGEGTVEAGVSFADHDTAVAFVTDATSHGALWTGRVAS